MLLLPNNVNSLHSLLQQVDDRSKSGVIGCNAIITPNPSYTVNSLQTGKESEYQYDYVQLAEVQHNKILEPSTSGGGNNDLVDNVNIDSNPSYSILQDVQLEDNPCYHKLQLQM